MTEEMKDNLLTERMKLANKAFQAIEGAKSSFKDGDWELGLEELKFSVLIVENIILTGKHSIWKNIYKDAKVPPYERVNNDDGK